MAGREVADADGPVTAPPPDEVARLVFGERLDVAQRFAELLAGAGVTHGLIGPGERARLWDRHLVNSAVVAELLPSSARIVDVGSGAGLPGLALAIRRPDLHVDLVEPMQRRVDFLAAAVRDLGLSDAVRVIRGRAEAPEVVADVGQADWVTARAVAPLGRLAAWCLPLLQRDGRLLAVKGARAEDEVRDSVTEVRRAGAVVEEIVRCGVGVISPPVTVVVVRRV